MRSDVCDTLAQQQLLVFKAFDLGFERAHDSRNGYLDDPLDILLDLLFDIGERRTQRCGFLLDVRLFALPQILEHRTREFDDLRARLRRAEHRLELAFDHIATDRLAVALTAFAWALIVRVTLALLAAARGPARSQGAAAIIAHDRTAQREILGEVGAINRAQAVQAVLNPLMRFESDERLVMALAALDAPLLGFDVTRVDRIAEHVTDALVRKPAALRLWKKRMLFEKSLDIGLTAEAPACITFQSLDDDRGVWFFPNEHLAVQSCDAAIAIAARSREHREAVLDPRLHAVPCLFGIVDAMVVGERDRHVFHEARRRTAIEHHARRFQRRACLGDRAAKIGVQVKIAGEAIKVVEDDAIRLAFVRRDEGDHIAQARPLAFATSQLVAEYARDRVAVQRRVLPQARFL